MKLKQIFFPLLFLLLSQITKGQNAVDYGSNNGQYLIINGTKMYFEEYGEGIPLLLLHGGLSSIHGFSTVIPKLSQHFRVIAIDAPGNGRSEQASAVSFKIMAEYYSQLIDQLKLDSVYVYGYSLGAITSLHLAANRPDKVKRLIAHSVVNELSGYNEGFEGTPDLTPEIVEEHIKWWLEGHLKRTPQPEKWKKFINDLQGVWSPATFISDKLLESIKSSCLIMNGDKDIIKLNNALYMHRIIENSQLCILPNSTHFTLWENPGLVLDVVMPYLLNKPIISYELGY